MKRNRGSALLYVLVMIFMLCVSSVAVLSVAYSNGKQSAFSEKYEQTYYDAESALSVAEAIFSGNIMIPKSKTGVNEYAAKSNLFHALYDNLDESKKTAENELGRLFPGADIVITFEIDEDTIMAENLAYDATEWISFFGGGYGETVSTGVVSILDATPIMYSISAASDNRQVEMSRNYTISGATFKAATDPTFSGDAEYVLAGQNLINGTGTNNKISADKSLNIKNYKNYSPLKTIDFPPADIPTPVVDISGEVNRVKGELDTLIAEGIPVITCTTSRTIRPEDLYFPCVIQVIGGGVSVTLEGDFSENLLGITATNGTIQLGSSTFAFTCDRSTKATPLYVYRNGGNTSNIINFTKGGYISNAVIAATADLFLNWDAGDNSCYLDAQIYSRNNLNINLKADNWSLKGVPSFIGNSLTVKIAAEDGFSGIFYSPNSGVSFSIDTPRLNGALFVGGNWGTYTFNNSFTNDPLELYCTINADAYNNLNNEIKEYFDKNAELVEDGGLITPPDGNAEYILCDKDGNVHYRSEKNPATIWEVDI